MNLPFTVDQFLSLFEDYNRAIWPSQIIAYLLGALAISFLFVRTKFSGRVIAGVLAIFWLWTGAVYHLIFFTSINPLAYGFAAAFVLEGVLLLVEGVIRRNLIFRFKWNVYSITGAVFIGYAILIYPLLNSVLGHGYPRSPSFGLTPCPVGIFTFGMLMLIEEHVPRHLMLIPFLWSVMGFFAAVSLGITEDIGLLIAGVMGSLMIITRDSKITAKRMKANAEILKR